MRSADGGGRRADGAPGRGRRAVLLALGSNVDPETHLFRALEELDRRLGIEAASAIYEADPVGAPGTPRFLNAVVLVRTARDDETLKREVLRPLEARLGRVRGSDPNAPRTIDIDIVGAERAASDGTGPGAGGRGTPIGFDFPDSETVALAHLALPLGDIGPRLLHPAEGITLGAIAARFRGAPGIRRREDLRWPSP